MSIILYTIHRVTCNDILGGGGQPSDGIMNLIDYEYEYKIMYKYQ